jgi:hypothetical protein
VSRPQFDRAPEALINGVTLVITTLDRLGRSTQNMLAFADELHARGAGLRVLNLSGGDVVFIDTSPGTTGIGALPRIAAIATAYAGTTSEPADLITSNDRLRAVCNAVAHSPVTRLAGGRGREWNVSATGSPAGHRA